jgi:hypothetical protein
VFQRTDSLSVSAKVLRRLEDEKQSIFQEFHQPASSENCWNYERLPEIVRLSQILAKGLHIPSVLGFEQGRII